MEDKNNLQRFLSAQGG